MISTLSSRPTEASASSSAAISDSFSSSRAASGSSSSRSSGFSRWLNRHWIRWRVANGAAASRRGYNDRSPLFAYCMVFLNQRAVWRRVAALLSALLIGYLLISAALLVAGRIDSVLFGGDSHHGHSHGVHRSIGGSRELLAPARAGPAPAPVVEDKRPEHGHTDESGAVERLTSGGSTNSGSIHAIGGAHNFSSATGASNSSDDAVNLEHPLVSVPPLTTEVDTVKHEHAVGAVDESVFVARLKGDSLLKNRTFLKSKSKAPVLLSPTATSQSEGGARLAIIPSEQQQTINGLTDEQYQKLPQCPEPSDKLTGHMNQALLLMSDLRESEVVSEHFDMGLGGVWRPNHCRSRHKVAIILPFRDRQSHLTRLLAFLIPMLKRQLLDFRFIVTEQYGSDLFNKGRIMNAAFTVADELKVDCVIFHDVDMFPQDDRTSYGCLPSPRHLGAYVNTLGYDLWYDYLVGGVLELTVEHYKQVNGYSNSYWAWGGEDDDMGKRILANKLKIDRPPHKEYDRYTMLKHVKRQRTAPKLIYHYLGNVEKNWANDGLKQISWKIIKIIRNPLYYHLYVDVGSPPEEWRTDKLASIKKKEALSKNRLTARRRRR